ncbi:hypothetical protein EXT47_16140 [Pseudoalteromonas sp. CO342X]|uniref:hypothetical protein n=1 Tax=Pseudoalteromonas sp. CO342X TaxID=1777270 RepID=UPI001023B4CA|nr:hypothetical protein [Pseudoalteromonas sp. CO342X]RZG13738.1 hypothetical protein EXT47_16140 [Pseudoalteromonas sp. CO342X]
MTTSQRNMKKAGITNTATTTNNIAHKYLHHSEAKRVEGENHGKALKCHRLELNTQQAQPSQIFNLQQLRAIAGGSDGLLKKDPKTK